MLLKCPHCVIEYSVECDIWPRYKTLCYNCKTRYNINFTIDIFSNIEYVTIHFYKAISPEYEDMYETHHYERIQTRTISDFKMRGVV